MAANNRERVLELIFGHEGRYSNHPNDPGGPTMFGITAATLGNARGLGRKATVEEVKALRLSEAREILSSQYLDTVKFDDLPPGLDYAVADFSVNSGPAQAVKTLQRVLGVDHDGVVGVQTLKAIAERPVGVLIINYQAARLAFMEGLDNWSSFKKGWTARVQHVKDVALRMSEAAPTSNPKPLPPLVQPAPLPEGGDAKADPKNTTVASTGRGKANIGALLGSIGAATAGIGPSLTPYLDLPWAKQVAAAAAVVAGVSAIIALILTRNHIANGNPV
jgi:lysozyme family protein